MNRKMLGVFLLVAVMLVVVGAPAVAAPAIQGRAGEAGTVAFESGPCARTRLAQFEHRCQRIEFALSAGSQDGLGRHRGTPSFNRNAEENWCARLDFTLSDGSGNALGLRSEGSPADIRKQAEQNAVMSAGQHR